MKIRTASGTSRHRQPGVGYNRSQSAKTEPPRTIKSTDNGSDRSLAETVRDFSGALTSATNAPDESPAWVCYLPRRVVGQNPFEAKAELGAG